MRTNEFEMLMQPQPTPFDLSEEEQELIFTGIMDDFNVSREEAEKNWEKYCPQD